MMIRLCGPTAGLEANLYGLVLDVMERSVADRAGNDRYPEDFVAIEEARFLKSTAEADLDCADFPT
jgi:hypothetical protein